jgi:hypothetical protein
MPLPSEVVTAVENAIKRHPYNDDAAIVSEVVETLGAEYPDELFWWLRSAGGAAPFVETLYDEMRRLKSQWS